jgi:hypothetical protein
MYPDHESPIDNQATRVPAARPDVHNAEVDEELAARDLCGMKHLATGNVCLLPQRHAGGCEFTSPSKR